MESKNKKHTIMFVPASGGIKQLPVSERTFRRILTGLFLFFIFNVTLFMFNVFYIPRFAKTAQVGYNTNVVRKELSNMENKVDSTMQSLERIASMEKKLRDMLDLPQISNEHGVVGIGGPSLKKPERTGKSVLELKGADLVFALDSLSSQMDLQLGSYTEICSIFENKMDVLSRTPSIKPVKGRISSFFGLRQDPFTGQTKMHAGIDIVAPKGVPVYATAEGVVTFTGWYHGYGNLIRINHKLYETRYAHLDRIDVRVGQKVKRGQTIGTNGRTGSATTNHVHYEVRVGGRPVDPMKFLYPENVVYD
jgi:murein DD-endopeptidase MepM/ murein hydrolase activator NlpD